MGHASYMTNTNTHTNPSPAKVACRQGALLHVDLSSKYKYVQNIDLPRFPFYFIWSYGAWLLIVIDQYFPCFIACQLKTPDRPTLEKEPITPFLDWAIVPLQRDISIVAPHLSRSYSLSTTSGQEIAACATLVAHLVAPDHSRRSQPRPSGARQPSPYV